MAKVAKGKPKDLKLRHVSFRLSAEEHFRLLDTAQRAGLSVGEFVRERALGSRPRRLGLVPLAEPTKTQLPAEIDAVVQLRKIGVNINQIAHFCHKHQLPPPPDLEPLLGEVSTLLAASFRPAPR